MGLGQIINKLSKVYNKFLMLMLGLGIFGMFIYAIARGEKFDTSGIVGITLLLIWGLFTFLSFIYSINGIFLNRSFVKGVEYQKDQGKPVEGIRGFDDLKTSLANARNYSLLITLSSIISLSIYLVASFTNFSSTITSQETNFEIFLVTLAITFAFLTISVLFIVEYPDDTSFKPGGLIGFYEPDRFKMSLDNLLSDVFNTYLDPATYVEIDEWSEDIYNRLSPNFESDEDPKSRLERAKEKILLLVYLNNSNPDFITMDVVKDELAEIMGEENVPGFLSGDETGISYDEIMKIMKRIENIAPEPFRLVDRLTIGLTDNYKRFTNEDLYFTIAVKTNQGSVRESTGIIAYFLNNTERDDREVLVEFLGGRDELHPHSQKIKLKLDPMTDPYPEEQPPFLSKTGEDILGILSDILQTGDAVWFRLKPKGFGFKVVTIQAEEIDGGKIMGESIELRFTKNLSFYVKNYLPKLSGVVGLAMPIIGSFLGLA